jgi:hypothetical protein
MKYTITIIISLILLSCQKERQTSFQAFLINKSGHKIEIRPHFGSTVPSDKIIRLQMNDSFLVGDGFFRGLVAADAYGFSSKYLNGADSLRIIFDDVFSITHYVRTPASFAPKYYLYTSLRNLGNYKSYAATSTVISKTAWYNEYKYTFTEQDYLDAK